MKESIFEIIDSRIRQTDSTVSDLFMKAGINPVIQFNWRKSIPVGLAWRYEMLDNIAEDTGIDLIDYDAGSFHDRVCKFAVTHNMTTKEVYIKYCSDLRSAKRGEAGDVPQVAKFIKLLKLIKQAEKDKVYQNNLNEPYH